MVNNITSIVNIIVGIGVIWSIIFTICNLRAEREKRELEIFENIFKDIRNYEEKLSKEALDIETRKTWDSLFLNTLEYASFLFNEKFISNKKILLFLKDVVKWGYEEILREQENWEDRDKFPELKTLYVFMQSKFRNHVRN